MPFGVWGAHRPNYIHGQFGGTFFVPQVPPAPRCTPVVISTKLTSRLSLAPCCAGQPSFGHIQAAPRRALAPVGSSPGLVIWPVSGTQRLASFPKALKARTLSHTFNFVGREPHKKTGLREHRNARLGPRHRQRTPCGHKRMNRVASPLRDLSGAPLCLSIHFVHHLSLSHHSSSSRLSRHQPM
jgi:hypothetical protein